MTNDYRVTIEPISAEAKARCVDTHSFDCNFMLCLLGCAEKVSQEKSIVLMDTAIIGNGQYIADGLVNFIINMDADLYKDFKRSVVKKVLEEKEKEPSLRHNDALDALLQSLLRTKKL